MGGGVFRRWPTVSHKADKAGGHRPLSRVCRQGLARRRPAALPGAAQTLLRRHAEAAHPARLRPRHAFVALNAAGGALAGVGRLSSDPDRVVGEYALLVRSDLQGHGIGWQLLRSIVAYAKAERIGRIEGIVLRDNTAMLRMCREFGFTIANHPNQPGLMLVTLEFGHAQQSG
ncbi:MAG: GNAT family N-acetyltransferase [Acetobacteraceae bacterium]